MKTRAKYVGLDVHKVTTIVAVADGGKGKRGPYMVRAKLLNFSLGFH